MCGRYALHSLITDLQQHFGLFDTLEFSPRYNVAPSLAMPVVRQAAGHRQLALCRWGFVPHWMKSAPGTRPINARAETLASKPYFRTALRRSRCLVPANGFYEWTRGEKPRQPWYFSVTGQPIMAFAGLWDRWEHDSATTETFAIITTAANDTLRPVHDRMPVILDPGQYDQWLTGGDTGVLRPYPGAMNAFPVRPIVNSPANDGPELLTQAGATGPSAG